jgi:hypothetical protein
MPRIKLVDFAYQPKDNAEFQTASGKNALHIVHNGTDGNRIEETSGGKLIASAADYRITNV